MVCDDSATIRSIVSRMLERDSDIRVVSRVANGQIAVETVKREQIDVVVLDIEMPVMDGLTALPQLLKADPGIRVIMASTLTTRGAEVALQALRLGAADYVPKPSATMLSGDQNFARDLVEKVKGLARLRRRATEPRHATPALATQSGLRPGPRQPPRLLAIGSSTGGPQALFTLTQSLGRDIAVPVVLTQHMPAAFTPILADHIAKLGHMKCTEARDGERLEPGHIYLAPGDRHLTIQSAQGHLQARLTSDAPENFCRPSVDPMLRSANAACDGRVLVVMLTGMGRDGLAGTQVVVDAGGCAIAQDEATSVVWGMPGAITKAGLVHAVLPLSAIGAKVSDILRSAGKNRP